MLTNIVNPALKLALGVASATVTFNTDGTAAIQTTGTSAAGATAYTGVASMTGISPGDFISTEGAGLGGTVPWVAVVAYPVTASGFTAVFPSARVAVSGAVMNRYERIETRYRAKKVTLTNLTNGDVYVWDTTLLDDQAKYTPSGGSTTTLANRGILNRSNCIGIHPNLLPVNCSFSLKCDYDYYS